MTGGQPARAHLPQRRRLRGTPAELLDIDLEDPDQRLVLQLACRARLLS